ncbi:MAG: spore coat protein GerQ [Bacilli bacterium]|nr:spore coat protein GerQ [Bacilli bacterium]
MTVNYQFPYGFVPPVRESFPQQFTPPHPPSGQNPYLYTEQSYIENILRLNRGKIATVYMNFEGSQWGSKIFKGELLEAGKDHIVLRDTQTNVYYLLLTIYLSYVAFDEEIDYEYPFS